MLLFRNTVVIVVQFSRSFARPRSLADSLYIISLRFPFVNPFSKVFSNFFGVFFIRSACATLSLEATLILYHRAFDLSIGFWNFLKNFFQIRFALTAFAGVL